MLNIDKLLEEVRTYNVGTSDYSKHKIQPWDIWKEYNLNPWDADIIKRVLRIKENSSREEDYVKIIHICLERIKQLRQEKSTNQILSNNYNFTNTLKEKYEIYY